MRSPNIHRVHLIEERDNIKAQFEAYKYKAQLQQHLYRIALVILMILVCVLSLLVSIHHG